MRLLKLLALPIIAITLLTSCSDSGMKVSDALSRSTANGISTAVIYMNLHNNDSDDALSGVSVDKSVATSATLHSDMNMSDSSMDTSDSDMTKMTAVQSIVIPKSKTVKLAPGGYHVMLEGLTKPLVNGDSFSVDLQFQHAPEQTVNVSVKDDI